MSKAIDIQELAMKKLYKNAFVYKTLNKKQIEYFVKIAQNK